MSKVNDAGYLLRSISSPPRSCHGLPWLGMVKLWSGDNAFYDFDVGVASAHEGSLVLDQG